MYKEIKVLEFKKLFLNNREELELIDVREKYEFDQIRIKWSKLIPLREVRAHLKSIDWTKKVIFICRTGARSEYITKVLDTHWFNWINLAWWINIVRFNCEECIKKWNIDKNYFE